MSEKAGRHATGAKGLSVRFLVLVPAGLTLVIVIAVLVGVFYRAAGSILAENENGYINLQNEIVNSAILETSARIRTLTREWSSWEETYNFALGANESYLEYYWDELSVLHKNSLNFAVIRDSSGNVLYEVYIGLSENGQRGAPDGFIASLEEAAKSAFEGYIPYKGELWQYADGLGEYGFMFYGGSAYYVCTLPILTSAEDTVPAGTFTLGRVFTGDELEQLAWESDTRLSLSGAAPDLADNRIVTADTVTMYKPLYTLAGYDNVYLRIEIPRAAYKSNLYMLRLTAAAVGVLILLLLGGLILHFDKTLPRPFRHLSSQVSAVTDSSTSVEVDEYKNNREFYMLSESINEMLGRVNQNRIMAEESELSLNVLKSILNAMDTYIYVSDPETDEILFINQKMKEHFGLGAEAVGSVCWKVLQSGFEEKCSFCPGNTLMKNPETTVVWEEHNTVTNRYYKNTDKIIDWVGGKKVHLQHSVDITDIKASEASLQRRLEQQEFMSDISRSFTAMWDEGRLIFDALKMSGEFMHVDQSFLSRYRGDENTFECLHEWYDENADSFIENKKRWPITRDMKIFKDLTVTGYAAVDDFTKLTHPNFLAVKEYGIGAFLNIPIDISGEFWGILGFVIYGRPNKWSESDIHLGRLLSGLFSGVISRENAKNEIIEAKELAENANKAKSEFLSRMSHEMRTPMNAIIGMTSIALNSDSGEKKNYCLGKIDDASRHLLSVINDVLDMSKIEANKFILSLGEFNLEKMLMNITNVINFRVEEKRQSFVINLDGNVPGVIIGDEMRLTQVLTNLLTNAAKFTPDNGSILLNVKRLSEGSGVCTLRFEVADNGIGISEEQQSRLFNSFEQADGGIARKYGGTGLGLVICKRIVELMGGEIWIESELGRGSKFIFTIKAERGEAIARTGLAKNINRDELRVLVVDDALEIRDYFTHIMAEFGLSCDVAAGGKEAVEMLETATEKPYNIFFIDWIMPEMDGVQLAARIKEIASENVIIIMISAAAWSDIEHEAVAAGVDRFISKPLFPSVIINNINECLGAPSKVESAASASSRSNDDFSGHTILLAEDVEINRELIAAMLEETGVTIENAENGAEAVRMFSEFPERYSLILMDIHMPEMDGYEVTRRIRAMDAGNIPIVAMTANVFREDIEQCRQAGMNDHIGKPVDTNDLLTKLRRYLPGKAPAGEAVLDYTDFLPAIDVMDGLHRLMNNRKLYFSLLANFRGRQMTDALLDSINAQNFTEAAANAHTLKGVAANLGLGELKAIATDIEEYAKMKHIPARVAEMLDKAANDALCAIKKLLAAGNFEE